MTLDLFRVVFVLAGALVGAAARSLGMAAPWQVHGNLWTVLLLLWQAQYFGDIGSISGCFCPSRGASGCSGKVQRSVWCCIVWNSIV